MGDQKGRSNSMDVTTDEEVQAVLLEGMEPQYIMIQRADADSLAKGVPLLTLNGDLISEGMVVDMINAGVTSEYNTATQYYEADDLIPHELRHEMTEVNNQNSIEKVFVIKNPNIENISH